MGVTRLIWLADQSDGPATSVKAAKKAWFTVCDS